MCVSYVMGALRSSEEGDQRDTSVREIFSHIKMWVAKNINKVKAKEFHFAPNRTSLL